jgi:hypothetical protein
MPGRCASRAAIQSSTVPVQGFREEEGLRTVITGDVRHAPILTKLQPRRNPFRHSFHTVCKIFA